MLKCPFCQFENEDGVLFCEQCKSDLGVAEAAVANHAAHAAPSAATESGKPVGAVALAETPAAGSAPPAGSGPAASPAVSFAEATPLNEVAAEVAAGTPLEAVPAEPAAPTGPDTTSPVPITEPEIVPAEEPGRLPAGSKPKLVVIRGQRVDTEYPLYEGDNYLGRADEKAVDIDLEDQEPPDRIWSSRQHALITLEDGKLTIEDLQSTNGTFVNRLRVHPKQKRPLKVNDIIQIGTVQMKVKV